VLDLDGGRTLTATARLADKTQSGDQTVPQEMVVDNLLLGDPGKESNSTSDSFSSNFRTFAV
jgi:hypothetical protein